MVTHISRKMNKLIQSNGYKFNEDGFIDLVKRLYIGESEQAGGMDEEKSSSGRSRSRSVSEGEEELNELEVLDEHPIEPTQQEQVTRRKKPSGTSRSRNTNEVKFRIYDLFSIVGVIVSVLVLYIAYNELMHTLCEMRQTNIYTDVSESMVEVVKKNLIEFQQMNSKELTFVSYLFNAFNVFGTNIVEHTGHTMKTIINDIIRTSVADYSSIAEKTCMMRGVETGSKTLDTFANYMIGLSLSYYSPSVRKEVSECIVHVGTELLQKDIRNVKTIMTGFSTRYTQTYTLFRLGVYIGYGSVGYLSYRTCQIYRRIQTT